MINDIGYYSLLAAMTLTFYSILSAGAGINRNSHNLIQSARYSQVGAFILILITYLALTYAFLDNDFSIKFVYENSSTDLPLFYKITAVWGGMEGSLLLWELLLSFFSSIVVLRYYKTNKEILPYVIIVLSITSLFLLFLLIGWSNPLAQISPAPLEGRGLNPLLQNPGMVFHPPPLYLGYVGFTIPFAFAMGAMIKGKLNNEWIITTRRWTLFAWLCLTIGMLIGGEWAYQELGWGGYWAWDPVENSSLLPWLTGTAFLHSVIVQEKRNSLKIWNMLLIIATFTLSLLGTFITRSGVLNSVHAFAKSPIGPAFLVFIAFVLIFSHILLFYRQSLLSSKAQKTGILSKENGFLLNNVFFVGMAFTVLYGTVFPLLAEGLADKKISIQAPFFNSIMTPIAILTVLLLGVTQVLGWKRTSLDRFAKNIWLPTGSAIIFMIIAFFFESLPWQVILLGGMTYYAGFLSIVEVFRSFLISRKSISGSSQKRKSGLAPFLLADRRRKGGIIVHLGIIVLLIGISGNFFKYETSFSIYPGQQKVAGDYTLKFIKINQFNHLNTERVAVEMEVYEGENFIGLLKPAKAYYPTSPNPLTEVAIKRFIFKDLYLSLTSINKDGSATLNVFINPMMSFVWSSMLFFIVGIGYSLSHKSIQLKNIRGNKSNLNQ